MECYHGFMKIKNLDCVFNLFLYFPTYDMQEMSSMREIIAEIHCMSQKTATILF